jgi:hypothetical protein
MPGDRSPLLIPRSVDRRSLLLPELGKRFVVVAVGAVIAGGLLCWLLFHLVTWPYRSANREGGHDRTARIEAAIALIGAFTALVAAFRGREALG